MDEGCEDIHTSPILWFVIPCYNEQPTLLSGKSAENGALALMAPRFIEKLMTLIDAGEISDDSRVCFVNDGSADATWATIEQLAADEPHVLGVSLSRNQGHQAALMCGFMVAGPRCDAAISMDCDGQDDIDAVDEMVRSFKAGHDVVYGVRSDRATDSIFKRFTAEAFYKTLSALGAETVFNHADYRLLSQKALGYLAQFKEVNLYLRGIVPMLGLKSDRVYYERNERVIGKSHYPLHKMLNLAIDGITSLSTKPIRIVSGLGIIVSLVGLAGIIWAIVSFALGVTVEGWASMLCVVSLLGGIQLLSLGVIGEYVGKIYLETKHRPRYLIEEYAGNFDDFATAQWNSGRGGAHRDGAGRQGMTDADDGSGGD